MIKSKKESLESLSDDVKCLRGSIEAHKVEVERGFQRALGIFADANEGTRYWRYKYEGLQKTLAADNATIVGCINRIDARVNRLSVSISALESAQHKSPVKRKSRPKKSSVKNVRKR